MMLPSPIGENFRLGTPPSNASRAFVRTLPWVLFGAVALAAAAGADISGTVVDDSAVPIAGATVHLQADPTGPTTVTNASGQFTLPVTAPGPVVVAAFVSYNRNNAANYNTNAVDATNPQSGIEIELPKISTNSAAPYPVPAVTAGCVFCHQQITEEWQTSVHAGAGLDFWVRDLFSGDGSAGGSAGYVFTASHDPGETGTCATCHQVMSDVFTPGKTMFNANSGPGVDDGVSCLGCHQIHSLGNPNGIHTLGSAEYRFPEGASTERYVWGPLNDVDTAFMRASYAPFMKDSQLCASCHQYQRPFGQTTYDEWLASPYAVAGPNFRSCQDCHMAQRDEDGVICNLFGAPTRPAVQRHRHDFVGSTPSTLAANIALDTTVEQTENGRVVVRSTVDNFGAGHDFPTGISIRNAILVITAKVNGQPLTQVAGPQVPAWADDDVPGQQPGDYAGAAGTGFAKILEGRINGAGPVVWPVLFIDAENVRELHKVPAGGTATTEVEFALPSGVEAGAALHVEARLLYRRAFRALAVIKGWTQTPQGGPIEIEVQADTLDLQVTRAVVDVPAAGLPALLLFALGLAGLALVFLRR